MPSKRIGFLILLALAPPLLSAGPAPSCCEGEATCRGASPCLACKNCNSCAHCNAGGSCGVCAKGRPYERPPAPPAPRATEGPGAASPAPRKERKQRPLDVGSEVVIYALGDDCRPSPCRTFVVAEGDPRETWIDSGTRALLLGRSPRRPGPDPGEHREVRLLSGPREGISCLVAVDSLRPDPLGFAGLARREVASPPDYARIMNVFYKQIYEKVLAPVGPLVRRSADAPTSGEALERLTVDTAKRAFPGAAEKYSCDEIDMGFALRDGLRCDRVTQAAKHPATNKASSALAVARALEKTNRKAAIDAYRKLVADFPGSAEAKAAGERLKGLEKGR